ATRAQWRSAQVRASVRSRLSLDELAGWLPATANARIHTGQEMAARFPRQALENAVRIGRECSFVLGSARPDLPRAPLPDDGDGERPDPHGSGDGREVPTAGAGERGADRAGMLLRPRLGPPRSAPGADAR